jgi:hypothetical protein
MGDDGGGGGGGGGMFDLGEEAGGYIGRETSLSVAGPSMVDTSAAGGSTDQQAEKEEESPVKKAGKVFTASTLLTGNPALSLIATGLYLGADALARGEGEPGEAPAVGNVDLSHPELSQFEESIFKPELQPVTDESPPPVEDKPPEDIEVVIPEQEAAENRRRKARKRTGYWSTRLEGGGEADVFTPSLFTI